MKKILLLFGFGPEQLAALMAAIAKVLVPFEIRSILISRMV